MPFKIPEMTQETTTTTGTGPYTCLGAVAGYRMGGESIDILPYGAEAVSRCEPVYEDFPGWNESTFGVREWKDLPGNARRYLERLSEVLGVPIDPRLDRPGP